jgi:hypothetical protein
MNIEQFITGCLDEGHWPPRMQDLPEVLEIFDPILTSMTGAFKQSIQHNLEVGFPINYHDKDGRLLGGGWQEGKAHSIAIKPKFLGHGISPVGSFHTHFTSEQPFTGAENPPSMADILNMAEPGNVITLVMSGSPEQPVYYLLIATQEFGVAHQELRKTFSRSELEQASEGMTMAEHEKLVKEQGVHIKPAMVQALWLDLTSSAKMLKFAIYVGRTSRLQLQKFD